jgi:ribonuclease Z
MPLSITILGSSSASPALNRNHSAQILNCNENLFLIDCGEGTQSRLRKYAVKIQRIKCIFISHLHGDHYLGLVGLLSTMHLLGRQTDINLYAPAELKDIIDLQFKVSDTTLRFKINFYPTNNKFSEKIYEDKNIEVTTFILNHRVPCTGFLFKEKTKSRKIIKETCIKHKVPLTFYNNLKLGFDFKNSEGKIIHNKILTTDAPPSLSYAYCSDTAFLPSIAENIKNVDLLYHEATFAHEHAERAKATFHSTTTQAAEIAKISNAKKLIIGHFSNRYSNLKSLLGEAKTIFKNTELAIEGNVFQID